MKIRDPFWVGRPGWSGQRGRPGFVSQDTTWETEDGGFRDFPESNEEKGKEEKVEAHTSVSGGRGVGTRGPSLGRPERVVVVDEGRDTGSLSWSRRVGSVRSK